MESECNKRTNQWINEVLNHPLPCNTISLINDDNNYNVNENNSSNNNNKNDNNNNNNNNNSNNNNDDHDDDGKTVLTKDFQISSRSTYVNADYIISVRSSGFKKT